MSDVAQREMTIEECCSKYRTQIKDIGFAVKYMLNNGHFRNEQGFENQHCEMKDNIMLSYRHLEDARMRLGKVMQQIQGGVSKYDK